MIRILKSSPNLSIQDLGRVNGLAYGIPQSGAMDATSLKYANHLVGNALNSPGIEVCLLGPVLLFEEACEIAIAGANLNPVINNDRIPINKPVKIEKGSELRFKGGNNGVYCYIAVKGKLKCKNDWGSYSTYSYAGFGGVEGRNLIKDDVIEWGAVEPIQTDAKGIEIQKNPEILVSKGPEFSQFPEKDIVQLLTCSLTVSNQSNRMGYQIEGVKLEGTKSGNIISSGTFKGVIQVPNSGKPMVLMSDSPCTGGYPRVLVVEEESVDRLAQILPGKKFRLKLV